MIKLKVPITRDETGIQFHEWEKEWLPLMPISHYLSDELDGVEINRVIWNGLSVPHIDKPTDISASQERTVFDQVIPRDGDELIVIPSFNLPIIPSAIYGIAIAGTVYGVSGVVLNLAIFAASIVVSTLLSYLTAPAKPKGQAMFHGPTSYGWQGIQNSYGPGDPIPVVLGAHKSSVTIIHYELEEGYA